MPQGRFKVTIEWEDGQNKALVFEARSEEGWFVSWNRIQEIAQNFARRGIHQISLEDFRRRSKAGNG